MFYLSYIIIIFTFDSENDNYLGKIKHYELSKMH